LASVDRSNFDDKSLIHSDVRQKKFALKIDLLPCYISASVAEKIFFIGESVQLFERDRKLESHGAVLKEQGPIL
jgi:Gamma tubulin complex component N-terminal